ncbi:MAG: hypothetical protein V1834_00990 [Candidatus Micrarchaeota archaeon]
MAIPFLDQALRKSGIQVWQHMPPSEEFKRKGNNASFNRLSMDNLWRVGTRAELVDKYNGVAKRTYKFVAFSLVFVFIAFQLYNAFAVSGDFMLLMVCGATVALAVHYWTRAWGGYAGDWTDYEHDPVRALTHNAYVLTEGRSMM